jgi:histidyl-tRNA synthetase
LRHLDLDIIGIRSIDADIDIIACMMKILAGCCKRPFTIRLGSRVVLNQWFQEIFGCSASPAALIVIDKLAKIGREKVKAGLEGQGLAVEGCERLLIALEKSEAITGSELEVVASRLGYIARMIGPEITVKVDLSIVRGLGYYTGLVFETTIDGCEAMGSVCSGGRYDHLLERFLEKEMPGVGGSIGIDRLIAILESLGDFDEKRGGVFIAILDQKAHNFAWEIAHRIRELGVVAQVSLKPGKVSQQFKLANRLGVSFVVTLGEYEAETKTLSLRHMQTQQEWKDLELIDLPDYFKDSDKWQV